MKELLRFCRICGIEKPLSLFNKHKLCKDGINTECKSCVNIRSRAWRKKNKDKTKFHNDAYRANNREKYIAYGNAYYQENKKRIAISTKVYRRAHKEEKKQRDKIYNAAHKNEANARARKRRKTDFKYRLNGNLSAAISASLSGSKNGKCWQDIVGYTLNKLKKHLEKQFTEGMTWENYGEWHIDHKIPISVFNFTRPEHKDFKKCWALKNLQPMWAEDNFKKGNKLIKHFQPSLLI